MPQLYAYMPLPHSFIQTAFIIIRFLHHFIFNVQRAFAKNNGGYRAQHWGINEGIFTDRRRHDEVGIWAHSSCYLDGLFDLERLVGEEKGEGELSRDAGCG